MAFVHSKQTRVVIGVTPLSCYTRSLDLGNETEMADVTVFCDEGHKFIPGLDNGTVSLGGVWDNDANDGAPDDVLSDARTAVPGSIVTIAPGGLAVGNRVVNFEARETTYSISSSVSDAVQFSADWQAEGRVDAGVSLHDLDDESSSGNGTAVDNSASTSNGGVASLHVTANDHDGATTIKVQHSADSNTWADLVTFSSVGASTTTSERKTVSGTVNRYLRATWALGGSSGSLTFTVSFCRR